MTINKAAVGIGAAVAGLLIGGLVLADAGTPSDPTVSPSPSVSVSPSDTPQPTTTPAATVDPSASPTPTDTPGVLGDQTQPSDTPAPTSAPQSAAPSFNAPATPVTVSEVYTCIEQYRDTPDTDLVGDWTLMSDGTSSVQNEHSVALANLDNLRGCPSTVSMGINN